MIEAIRKTICIDESKSHRNGLVPYIVCDGANSNIFDVTPYNPDGNYGEYPCDFAFIEVSSTTNDYGVEVQTKEEVSRLAYMDVMARYRYIQDRITNGILVKRSVEVVSAYTKYSCTKEDTDSGISDTLNSDESEIQSFERYKWSINFFSGDTRGRYDYLPIDANYFNSSDGKNFYINVPSAEKGSEKAAAITALAEGDEEYFILISDYDTVMSYEGSWNEWWTKNYEASDDKVADRWEVEFFDDAYVEPQYFKFCQDVDKYLLGKVFVPEYLNGNTDSPITGALVPQYVYYTNFAQIYNRLKEAEKMISLGKQSEQKYESLGGDNFKAFLGSIKPHWIKSPSIFENGRRFAYLPPRINIPLLIDSECSYEGVYMPYEKSVIDGEVVYLENEYQVSGDGMVGSALCPTFIEADGFVESKLETFYSPSAIDLGDGIKGILTPFKSPDGRISGQLFKCTFHVGESDIEGVRTFRSGTTNTYSDDGYLYRTKVNAVELIDDMLDTAPPVRSEGTVQIVGITRAVKSVIAETDNAQFSEEKDGERVLSKTAEWNETVIYEYTWWECEPIETKATDVCADGEKVLPSERKYRNVPMVSCVDSLIAQYGTVADGDVYYVMAKYDNGDKGLVAGEYINETRDIVSMALPYITGVKVNKRSMDDGTVLYDEIFNTSVSGGEITIEYVVGAAEGEDIATSGVHYKESLPFSGGVFETVVIDNIYNAELYYDKVDLESLNSYIYSDDYRLYRKARKAKLTGIEVGGQWTAESAISAKLITKDGLDALIEEPRYNISLAFDRGNAAAWETHFKLMECNTVEDLENYGNNYFNL